MGGDFRLYPDTVKHVRVILWTLAIGLCLSSACDGRPGATPSATPEGGGRVLEVHGLVTDVEARSLTQLDFLSIQDSEGRRWTFGVQGFLELTPSHLREHQALALPVTVRYGDTSAGLLAISVAD